MCVCLLTPFKRNFDKLKIFSIRNGKISIEKN